MITINTGCCDCVHKDICKFEDEYRAFLQNVEEILNDRSSIVKEPSFVNMKIYCKYFQRAYDIETLKGNTAKTMIVDDVEEMRCALKNSNSGASID